jgi:gliding motility-associated-like protein
MKKGFLLFIILLLLRQFIHSQTSTCNFAQINAAMANAGFQPLNVPSYPCALYFYNPNTTNSWNTAQSQAAAVGATLLTVCDLAENNAVWNAAVAAGVSGGLWIGLSDQANEGTWLWADGGNCNFTNWNAGEPSNSSCFPSTDGEDGAIIQMANGLWNDVYLGPTGFCANPAAYASLIKVNLCPQITPAVSAQNVCQGDPVQLSATTIFGSSPYSYSWFDANNNQLGTGSPFTYNSINDITVTGVVTDQYGCSDSEQINVTTQNCNPQVAGVCCPFDGWDYIMPITITNNTALATTGNLQTLLIIDTQTPISQNKMQANGNDIRFIEGVCTNVIPHYIESGINTPQTNIWVRLPSISPGGSLTIFMKYGNATAPSGAVPFTGSANAMFPSVLTATNGQNLAGTQTFDWINIPAGVSVTTTNVQPVILNARKIVFDGVFDGQGKGYAAQAGPGAGPSGGGSCGGAGGAYGGAGGDGGSCNNASVIYGTTAGTDIDMGSGGGNSDCNGARGGGNIQLFGSVIQLNGTINVQGNANTVNSCTEEGGGGGAGGGVLITADYLSGIGNINARGGAGENSTDKEGGGGGGGGRVKFFYSQVNSYSGVTQVNGAAAGTGGQSGMSPGQNGTFNAAQIAGLSTLIGTETPVSIPTAIFSSNDVCQNNPSVFTDQSTVESLGSISSWQWDFGDGSGTSTIQNPSYDYSAAGQYTVSLVVTTVSGCADTITTQITVNPGATADFSSTNVCLGDVSSFSDLSSTNVTNWEWNFQDGNTSSLENPTNTFLTAGSFDVELVVGTTNGCTDTISNTITIYPLPIVNAGQDVTICAGETVTLSANGAQVYNWNPNTITNGQNFTPNASGIYTVTGVDANGCEDTDDLNIVVLPVPDAIVSANPLTGFPGDIFTFTNTSTNALTYNWNFGNGETTLVNDLSDQTQSYTAPGTYTIELNASNGLCADSSFITVIVLTPDVEINVPNVFTVNNDGINDEWQIIVKNASAVKVDIQNRWGNTMLTLGANESWDGTIDGKDAKDGVYFYRYEIQDNFGQVFKGHGHFTLIRTN